MIFIGYHNTYSVGSNSFYTQIIMCFLIQNIIRGSLPREQGFFLIKIHKVTHVYIVYIHLYTNSDPRTSLLGDQFLFIEMILGSLPLGVRINVILRIYGNIFN